MTAITVQQLNRHYKVGKKSTIALQDVSFSVETGELFGLIGPDGAGKTTLIRILTTLLKADSGSVTIDGLDVVKDYKLIRSRVGYMPGKFSLYQDLTVAENISFFANIFGVKINENYDLIKEIYVQIKPFETRKVGKLSGGMKQKLALCCALIHQPTILFLDEPSTGVDAVSRKEFWEVLKQLVRDGITILVSTPYMDEASLCDRVALMQEGSILSINSPVNIINQFKKPLWSVRSQDMYRLLQDLRTFSATEDCYPFGEFHHWVLTSPAITENQLRCYLAERLHQQVEICLAQANIEDCFIALMKSKISRY